MPAKGHDPACVSSVLTFHPPAHDDSEGADQTLLTHAPKRFLIDVRSSFCQQRPPLLCFRSLRCSALHGPTTWASHVQLGPSCRRRMGIHINGCTRVATIVPSTLVPAFAVALGLGGSASQDTPCRHCLVIAALLMWTRRGARRGTSSGHRSGGLLLLLTRVQVLGRQLPRRALLPMVNTPLPCGRVWIRCRGGAHGAALIGARAGSGASVGVGTDTMVASTAITCT